MNENRKKEYKYPISCTGPEQRETLNNKCMSIKIKSGKPIPEAVIAAIDFYSKYLDNKKKRGFDFDTGSGD